MREKLEKPDGGSNLEKKTGRNFSPTWRPSRKDDDYNPYFDNSWIRCLETPTLARYEELSKEDHDN